MKKVCVCIVAQCLVTLALLGSPQIFGWEYFEDEKKFSESEIERLREEFKDVEKLKLYFGRSLGWNWFIYEIPPRFKRKFNVDDAIMYAALTNIFYESSAKIERELWNKEDPLDIQRTKTLQMASIQWLGACTNANTKTLLMDIAIDDTKEKLHRSAAIGAYLQCANAQEARDALVRFLRNTRIDPYSTYVYAIWLFDETKGDTEKSKAILSALSNILVNEEDKNLFFKTDKKLAERSKEYADSPQRKAALERMNKP